MKGIGLATTAKIFTEGLFETIQDIFSINFTEEALIKNTSFVKGRELEILLQIVNGVKNVEYWKVINALKITGNGRTLSKQLANYFSEVDYDFAGLEKAVVDKFMHHTPEFKSLNDFANTLEKKGIEILYPVKVDTSLVIGFYEMTGSPKEQGFKVKADFTGLAEKRGFQHAKLDKNCNFLITDNVNATSSKMKKAEKLGVETITYSDFADKYLNL
jgi:NAD-dependent DNA ligase